MSSLRLSWLAALALAGLVLVTGHVAAGGKYALLVGCTQYQNGKIRELWGPANDVRHWNELLTDPKGFAFPQENVRRLVAWPDDVKARPTRANIAAGFEELVGKAGPDVRIFILLSGHGMQVPIPESQTDPYDPKNPEPDGLDEVFLPADVEGWSGDGLKNALLDDEIGAWLRQMRDKGADVWVVFDCCHSGTMTRGTPQDVERPRTVRPQEELGIPVKAFEDAARKVAQAPGGPERGRGAPAAEPPLGVTTSKDAKGSLVAFYGAQPFEEAPELPRPAGAPLVRDNYFGMLSYTTMQVLRERQSPLSYRELSQVLLARYRADRASRPPSPFAEGDLDREVLGERVWPKRADLLLQREKDRLTVNAGSLRGLVADCVLAVHPPPGDARPAEAVIGHVRVRSSDPVKAVVEPCDEKGQPGGDPAALPELSRCELVVQDLGDLRIKLALAPKDQLEPALGRLDKQVAGLVKVVPEAEADWLLRKVTPAEAEKDYGLKLDKESVLLVHGEGKAEPGGGAAVPGAPARRVYGGYPPGDPAALAAELDRDLQKVFKWQNLWRVGGTMSGGDASGQNHGLKFEVLRLKDKNDKVGEPLNDVTLTPGQMLGFRLSNEGAQDLWVSALFCGGDFGIEVYYTGALKAGAKLNLPPGEANADSLGAEGMIVLALPQSVSKDAPRFDFLAQEPLGKPEAKARGADEAPRTPFGQVLAAAAFNRGTKGLAKQAPTNPSVQLRTWRTVNVVAR